MRLDGDRVGGRGWQSVLAAVSAVALLVGGAGVAGADDIVNNLDGTIDATAETTSTTVGGTTTVNLYENPANGDGKNGCNLTGSTTLVVGVGSSNAAVATVSPSSVTFTSCGDVKAVTVTGQGAGTAAISLTLTSNNTGGTFDLAPATFEVTVASPCPPAPVAPSVTPMSAPASSGWYNAASGAAGFTVSPSTNAEYSLDGGAHWTSYPAATGVTFGTDGARSVVARRFVPAAGSCARVDGAASAALGFKVDRTAPTYAVSVSPDANTAGWNNTTVQVTYACNDDGSGLAAACPSAETWVDGTILPATTSQISDLAGNVSVPATRRAIKVDTVRPTVSAVVPPPTGGEWNSSAFTVSYTCADGAGSQVVACPGPELFTEEGSPYDQRSVTVTDAAGNVSEPFVRRAVQVDSTAPTAAVAVSPSPNGAGWNNSPVTATYMCADTGGSTLATPCPDDETFSTDGDFPAKQFAVKDVAGNTSGVQERRHVLLDQHRPDVSLQVTDENGDAVTPSNGWYNRDVWVRFSCDDNEYGGVASGVQASAPYACPEPVHVTSEGTTPSSSYEVRDNADNQTSVTVPAISIDRIAPTLTVSVTPDANGDGWNNSAVTVDWTCHDNDGGSGIDPLFGCPVPDSEVLGDGTDRPALSRSVRDLAGNESATAEVRAIKIDEVAPTITVTLRDSDGNVIAPNANGWFHQEVTVDFTCADTGGSGLVSSGAGACPADYPLSDGEFDGYSARVSDRADNNSAPVTVPAVRIDTVKPVISDAGPVTGPDGDGGWYKTVVTNQFTATDDRSGLAEADQNFNVKSGAAEGSAVTISSGTVSDLAGNTADAVNSQPFKIDLSDPTNVHFIGTLADGGVYVSGSVPAVPTCDASDSVSGLARCDVSGYSTIVGSHTLTATARDYAGRTATASLSYTVRFATKGFYAPVDMGGVVNSVKGGSTVPLKFEVFDDTTEVTSTAVVSSLKYSELNCTTLGSTSDDIETTATGGTSLRYDTTAGQFIYNWQTPKTSGKCYTTTVTLTDGSTIQALFKTK